MNISSADSIQEISNVKLIYIGASGFIGRYVMRHASTDNIEILGTRFNSPSRRLVRFDLQEDRITQCIPECFKTYKNNSFAVIGAGISAIDLCAKEPERTASINVTKTIQLIDDLASLNITPVYLSTSYIFDGKSGPYNEASRTAPLCEYGRQKAEVERYLSKKHPEALILRFDKVVGDTPGEHHLFSEWLQLAKSNKPISCICGQMMSPTFVTDVAQAIVTACRQSLNGIYHVSNNEFVSRAELARLFLSITGLTTDVIEKPMEAFGFLESRPLNTCLVSSQFMNKSGMQFTKLREGLASFAKQIH